jgi:hypothetical protein
MLNAFGFTGCAGSVVQGSTANEECTHLYELELLALNSVKPENDRNIIVYFLPHSKCEEQLVNAVYVYTV